MDLFTYHTLMMGHTKLGRHQKVLSLYNEALESSAKVRNILFCRIYLAFIFAVSLILQLIFSLFLQFFRFLCHALLSQAFSTYLK